MLNQWAYGEDDPCQLAAAYAFGIVRNHPFVDGNKRTGWVLARELVQVGVDLSYAPVLDLDYAEDSTAETDANFVLTGSGGIVEIQGTAEGDPFGPEQMQSMLALAAKGIGEITVIQKQTIDEATA